MVDVTNKWALITGASRGIGKSLALFLAEKGCNLILHGRSLSGLEAVNTQAKSYNIKTHLVSAELSNLDEVYAMLNTIDNLGHTVDFVFNNAGVQIAYRVDYLETPASDFTDSYTINTITPIIISYHFLKKMIPKGFGRIINTTSGIDKEPEQAGYSASKAALDKLTKDLGSKLDNTGVIMSLFDPGWCRTDLGGPNAPNSVESTLPGSALGAFLDDGINGRIIRAQSVSGMTIEEALKTL